MVTAIPNWAHLLERNRKFELFLVEKLAELEKRTGPAGARAGGSLDDDELFAPRSSLTQPAPVAPTAGPGGKSPLSQAGQW